MDSLTDPMIASQIGRLERRIAKLETERDRLRDHIYQHRAQFTKSTPVRAVDLELWAALEGE